MTNRKTFGLGTAALFILALGFLFNYKFADGFMISHYLFQQLNLNIYSNGESGFHYPFIVSILFWLPAVLLSRKHRRNYGATISYKLGGVLLIVTSAVSVVFLVDYFII
ncbi:hypothetical protein D3P07_17675 [Paenibacillus sp. 1011MAR3C5]|uniref:hypothetical protein n=1 Tax=Paenibacillus sp. 1011MAR3C5 TaxID=1675787 RepID=UPI000E6CC658|nr:hypothetical protein [Paenibacillus sp. 1011MAR3C5]RJE87004.1 hypothetical protein D3P07_17675 [Paenibacillus sp. 1011MAR3C5]